MKTEFKRTQILNIEKKVNINAVCCLTSPLHLFVSCFLLKMISGIVQVKLRDVSGMEMFIPSFKTLLKCYL